MINSSKVLVSSGDAADSQHIHAEVEQIQEQIRTESFDSTDRLRQLLDIGKASLIICNESEDFHTCKEILGLLEKRYAPPPLIIITASWSREKALQLVKRGAASCIPADDLKQLAPAAARAITEHRKSQELEHTRSKFNEIANSVNGIVWEADAETFSFNFVSPQSESILGYNPDQWYADDSFWANQIHPEDRQRAVRYCHYKSKRGENHSFEYRMLDAEGNIVWLRDYVTVVQKEDSTTKLRGIMVDITQQKRVEQQRDRAYELADIGDWEFNAEKQSLYWSQTVRRLHEVDETYEPDLEAALEFYVEGHRKRIEDAVENALEDGTGFDLELKIVTAKGNFRWVRAVGEAQCKNGNCTRILGTTQNITERRQMEKALRKSELRFKSLVQEASELIAVISEEGIYRYVAPTSERRETLQKAPDSFIGQSCFDFIHEDDRKLLEKKLHELEPYQQLQTAPFRFCNGNGEWRWLKATVTNLTDNPAINGYVTNSKDITEQVHQQEKLKEALERYEYVTRATDDVIYDWDIVEDELLWDDSFKSKFVYGITEGRYTIKTWEKNVHPDDLASVKESLCAMLDSSKRSKWEEEYRFQKKNGEYATVFERGFIIRNADGEAVRMIGTLTDVTNRKQTENDLRNSLKEKETLLLEIHHRVKNNLAVVSGMMQLQAFNAENALLREKLFDSVTRIQTMVTIHELLYNSESFAELDFDKNVRKLISETIETFRPRVKLQTKFNLQPTNLNINQAIPCSLIINEIITNILKYGFDGRKQGVITTTLDKRDGQIIIDIEDDGNGLPNDFGITDDTQTLGLKLIKTLSDQLDATYVYKNMSAGAQFRLSFTKATVKGTGNAGL